MFPKGGLLMLTQKACFESLLVRNYIIGTAGIEKKAAPENNIYDSDDR